MCFSAKASFIAAGTLSAIGLVTINKAKKTRALIPFASTPLLFGFQQACEGIVWLGLTGQVPYPLYTTSMYSFIFMAGTWWPIWIPTVLYLLETDNVRKNIIFCCIIGGSFVGIFYLICLVIQPLGIDVINHHIYYPLLSYPLQSTNLIAYYFEWVIAIGYFIATLLPFFVCRIALTSLMGVVIGIGLLTSTTFFKVTAPSTWCFFAAITSGLVYLIVKKYKSY